MTDVMIDIETLGNGKQSIPVQLGGVFFDRKTGVLGDEFKINIDARDAVKFGCQFDADTVYWWLSQSDQARASIVEPPLEKLYQAMQQFYVFMHPATAIWSHATFDFVIIQETLKLIGHKPMSYRKARDIRTLIDLANVDYKKHVREGTHHDALADAIFQVKYCVEAFHVLEGK